MPSEFELIDKYFKRPTRRTKLGVGDDCALIECSPESELAISTDMLVAGTHFFADADPLQLGHKTLAVNLSDMAAMGATPRWATLAAALPTADEAWIAAFARGFFALAEEHGVDVIGGDTTRGPLAFCVTIIGEVPRDQALLRSGARVGDDVWLSGTVGDAALALAHLQGRALLTNDALTATLPRLNTPAPRVALGIGLRGIATACIDVSDGLLADLSHVLEQSRVGAEILLTSVPRSPALLAFSDQRFAENCALTGGDDYELCFTAPASRRDEIQALRRPTGVTVTRVGGVTAEPGLRVTDARGDAVSFSRKGFDHFG